MKRLSLIAILTVSVVLLFFFTPKAWAPPPPGPLCRATAGGQIVGATFAGNAQFFKDGRTDGKWVHVTEQGDTFVGDVDDMNCANAAGGGPGVPQAGFNFAELSGEGSWNGEDVCVFVVEILDRGEPGDLETYLIAISGAECSKSITKADAVVSGNIQILPNNPGHPWF